MENNYQRIITKGLDKHHTELNLAMRGIGPQFCEQLIQNKWPSLKLLILGGNSIGDEGCWSIRKAQWPALRILSLWNNRISNLNFLSCPALPGSSQNNFCNLRELFLSYNLIESIEPLTWLNSISLSKIQLGGNQINTIDSIKKIKSKSLEGLVLDENPLNEICGLDSLVTKLKELNISYWNQRKDLSLKPLIKCQLKQRQIKLKISRAFEQQTADSLQRKYKRNIFI